MNIENHNQDEINQEKPERHPKFYIALLVCLAAVSAAGWSTYKTVKEFVAPQKVSSSPRISRPKENMSQVGKKSILEESPKEENDGEAIPYQSKNAKTQTSKPTELAEKSKEEKVKEKEDEIKEVWAAETSESGEKGEISYPVENIITKEFSGDVPIYCKTLCDWRAHKGTDFKAEKGSMVKAMSSGVVTDIYEDSSYGMTVVISHDGGFTAYYSGLGEKVLVKRGAKVKNGEEIGVIDKVPCEALEDEPHLHLCVNKDGKFIDPLLILDKEN